jgi:DNA-binding IclR family transcriptional regulator
MMRLACMSTRQSLPWRAMSKAVARFAEVLDVLAASPSGLSVTETAALLGVSKTTSSRLLASLIENGLVEKDDAQRHVLDLRFWSWGAQAARRFRLLDISRPPIIDAVNSSGLPIYIGVPRGDLAFFLEKTVVLNGVPVVVPITFVSASVTGTSIPLYACAPGKAMLAFGPEELLESVLGHPLKPFTPQTVTTPEALLEQIHRVRSEGFAVNRGEYFGHLAVGVPIFDHTGVAVAALGTAGGMYGAEDDSFVETSVAVLRKAAERISASLGHLGALSLVG